MHIMHINNDFILFDFDFIAVDFDDTLIEGHTEGLPFSMSSLRYSPNMFLINLVRELLSLSKSVSIVTFGHKPSIQKFSDEFFN